MPTRVDHLLRQVDGLPTLPAVAVRVLEATGDDDSSVKDVIAVLKSDPPLTARMLQLVRRADLGVRGEVDTVDRAVALLGFDAVRSAVLAVGVFETLASDQTAPGGGRFDRNEFWKHAVAVACCGELLADAVGIPPSTAFVAGLLHDIGKVALDALLPKSFNRVVEAADLLRGNIADLERSVIGIDHLTAGKHLAEHWQLPAAFAEVAWLHGQSPAALPADLHHPRLVNLISLADLLVREQHLGYSGNHVLTGKDALLAALQLRPEQVERAVARLVPHMEPRAAALGLAQATTDELYRTALTRANRELGRVGDQLAAKNRKLQARAKFFDALTKFQSDLTPDADPPAVLRAIGRAAALALEVPVVATFSLCADDGLADVFVHRNGEPTDVGPTPLTAADLPAVVANPVRVAGRSMAAVLAAVGSGPYHYCVSLGAAPGCVGGVVWPAATDEADRLGGQSLELIALAHGWTLALRTAQVRDAHKAVAERLAAANRKLHDTQAEVTAARAMAAVGEMAAGAAHEVNTPLAVLSGRAQLLASQLSDLGHRHAADTIVAQAERVSRIVADLMEFADPAAAEREETDVATLLDRAIAQAKATVGRADRPVVVTLRNDLPDAFVDGRQVAAAVAELVANAMQAADGRVTVSAARAATGAADGDVVVVTVADDGPGMDAATAAAAFDPFYSRKAAGRRRGLGLAKAARWIAASGGTVRLDTQPGRGTRAVVTLPVATATTTV